MADENNNIPSSKEAKQATRDLIKELNSVVSEAKRVSGVVDKYSETLERTITNSLKKVVKIQSKGFKTVASDFQAATRQMGELERKAALAQNRFVALNVAVRQAAIGLQKYNAAAAVASSFRLPSGGGGRGGGGGGKRRASGVVVGPDTPPPLPTAIEKLQASGPSWDDLRKQMKTFAPPDLETLAKLSTQFENLPLPKIIEEAEKPAKKFRVTLGELNKKLRELFKSDKGFIESLKEMRKEFADIRHAKSFTDRLIKIRDLLQKPDLLQTASKAAVAQSGFAALGGTIGLVTGALGFLKKALFAAWDFADSKFFPTLSGINRAIGNMGPATQKLTSQAIGAGDQFEKLGLDFASGAATVQGLATSMNAIRLPKETLDVGMKLAHYVGLGAEQAGKLLLTFNKTDGSIKRLNETMKDAEQVANQYAIPVNLLRQDFGQNIDLLQRFGTANVAQFSKSAAKARAYGLDIRQVNATFGRTLDTFEGTTDVAAKLNTAFGTNINSMKLLLETNPEKRFEMINEELQKQGKSWKNLDPFMKNVLTDTLKITNEQGALYFAQGNNRKEIEKYTKQQAKQMKLNNDWEKGIGNLKSSLINFKKELELLMRATSDVIARFFGFNNSIEMTKTGANAVQRVMEMLTKSVQEFGATIDPNRDNVVSFKDGLRDILDLAKDLIRTGREMKDTWDNVFNWYDKSKGKEVAKQLVTGHVEAFSTTRLEDLTADQRRFMDEELRKQSFKPMEIEALIAKRQGRPVDPIIAQKTQAMYAPYSPIQKPGSMQSMQSNPYLPDIRIELNMDSTKVAEKVVSFATRK